MYSTLVTLNRKYVRHIESSKVGSRSNVDLIYYSYGTSQLRFHLTL